MYRHQLMMKMPMMKRLRPTSANPCGEATIWPDLTGMMVIPSEMTIRRPLVDPTILQPRNPGGMDIILSKITGEDAADTFSACM